MGKYGKVLCSNIMIYSLAGWKKKLAALLTNNAIRYCLLEYKA